MSSMKTILSACAIAFLASTDAHMIMAQPKPYGEPDNSPLLLTGTDFPCKGKTSTGVTPQDMTIGASNPLSFTGSAVHGGGSCQISLTKDQNPTPASVWQVILSIEGGCPAKNQAGNLGGPGEGADNPAMSDPNTYSFTIPKEIAPGTYTLAWTWFNKVGNREMYMNCAWVNVKGGSGKRDALFNETEEFAIPEPELVGRDTSLPGMFTANIAGDSGCRTLDGDLTFPDPGPTVQNFSSSGPFVMPGPGCKGGKNTASDVSASGSGSGSGPSGASGATGSSGASDSSGSTGSSGASGASPSASTATGSGSGSGAAPLAAPSNAVSGASSPAAANASTNPSSSSTGTASGSPGSSGPASGFSSGTGISGAASGSSSGTGSSGAAPASPGACSSAGTMICSPDGTQFGLCTAGLTAVMQPVAAGTSCKGGQIQKRSLLPRRPLGQWSIWA